MTSHIDSAIAHFALVTPASGDAMPIPIGPVAWIRLGRTLIIPGEVSGGHVNPNPAYLKTSDGVHLLRVQRLANQSQNLVHIIVRIVFSRHALG